mgnify:CR=1 FL=1
MVSCKTQYDMILEGNDIPAKYKMAFELFEKEKNTKAASMFESMNSSRIRMFEVIFDLVDMKSLNANEAAIISLIRSPELKLSYSYVPPSVMNS